MKVGFFIVIGMYAAVLSFPFIFSRKKQNAIQKIQMPDDLLKKTLVPTLNNPISPPPAYSPSTSNLPEPDPVKKRTCPVCTEQYSEKEKYCPICENPPILPKPSMRRTETFGQAARRANGIIPPLEITPSKKLERIPDELLTGEQKEIINEIHTGTPVILITGKAGTGKSTLIQHIRLITPKQTATVAFTGIAALNIGGQTIHSFFQFPHEPLTKNLIEKSRSRQRLDLLEKLELLVIDEISMVRADLLDGINWYLQKNRSGKEHVPFGGVQVIMAGDPFQLPPFASSANGEERALAAIYKDIHFFNAKSLEETPCKTIELTTVFRQQDPLFIKTLNKIREGVDISNAIATINTTCKILPDSPEDSTCLTPRRRKANLINESKLDALPGKKYELKASYEGAFERSDDPDKQDKTLPAPDPLFLKIGARVMFVKNDKSKRWVNGSRGVVETVDMENGLVQIRLDATQRVIGLEKETWDKLSFSYDKETDSIQAEIIGSYKQYPLIHAWAATIHKAQGQTIDSIHIDLDSGAFETGQTYVAFSRCPKLGNITLARELQEKDIKVSSTISRFMNPSLIPSTPV